MSNKAQDMRYKLELQAGCQSGELVLADCPQPCRCLPEQRALQLEQQSPGKIGLHLRHTIQPSCVTQDTVLPDNPQPVLAWGTCAAAAQGPPAPLPPAS